MPVLTQPLRDEHKDLFPHVAQLRDVADAVAEVSSSAWRADLDEVIEFLTHHLLPHAMAEEQALYPVVARVLGAPQATATMSRDHVEVERLTHELVSVRAALSTSDPSEAQVKSLRRLLYGLYTLVGVHFAKEEEVYLSLLDERLTPNEAGQMFDAMEQAAHSAKVHAIPALAY